MATYKTPILFTCWWISLPSSYSWVSGSCTIRRNVRPKKLTTCDLYTSTIYILRLVLAVSEFVRNGNLLIEQISIRLYLTYWLKRKSPACHWSYPALRSIQLERWGSVQLKRRTLQTRLCQVWRVLIADKRGALSLNFDHDPKVKNDEMHTFSEF